MPAATDLLAYCSILYSPPALHPLRPSLSRRCPPLASCLCCSVPAYRPWLARTSSKVMS
ncbi:hypothetical protein T440DRAFT_473618 [Plenodomus tracheiphilus IPT5]|uniref:Uncharacterized protein n=1 Tax=Plenodomus tracheiphilus IPT5 TaxID=1408161 RepID=A0A6A7AM12_9PLEO|nr:hypothetical protein T440DRAFT_473618 [Plenodomus tracheiphilus IPT5]